MKNVFKPLADMDFANILREAYADTQTGASVLNKYRQHMLTNESSCSLVNGFLKEAHECMYDGGIAQVVAQISDIIEENRVNRSYLNVLIKNGKLVRLPPFKRLLNHGVGEVFVFFCHEIF